MKLIKNIKKYFRKKVLLSKQTSSNILNIAQYDDAKKTIVFITNCMPKYDQDSGSNRLKEIIIAYQELQYNCIICAENIFEEDRYVTFYKDLGLIIYIETSKFKNYFEFLKSLNQIDYIWFNGPKNLNIYLNKLSKEFTKAVTIFDMVDIHFLRFKRAIELEPNRISLKKKYYKYYRIETQLAKKANIIVAISDTEKDIMSQYCTENKIITISNIHYPRVAFSNLKTFEQRQDILFIGSAHEPNIDGVYYLFNEIMPIVWQQLPDLKVNVIGNVLEKINNINHPNFNLLGYVENIESYFLDSKLMIAPLRFGAGVKGKIGQAFEYFLPVVTTTIGAEGMLLENEKHVYISNTADELAQQIIKLYTNPEIWTRFSNNSTESLCPFSREKIVSVIKGI